MNNGAYFGLISGIFIALFAFGVAFNMLTSYMSRKGLSEGYTWLLVVIGVLVTVLAAGLVIGWESSGILILFFVASGTPMALGDIYRYVKARQGFQEYAGNADTSEEVAE